MVGVLTFSDLEKVPIWLAAENPSAPKYNAFREGFTQ